ncbi:hypothetical protein ANN_27138 [Periplaneta americana]|uniref:Uncharacterized protein n=1 Tax=Periplaneta americana TaxID=6978 RepID=A0ABQ8RXB9_PERAM|nr:hypothetical protein ANN_27138 [Periplaneta americana]
MKLCWKEWVKNADGTDQKEKKELVGTLAEKKLHTEGCTGRNGEREKSLRQKKISVNCPKTGLNFTSYTKKTPLMSELFYDAVSTYEYPRSHFLRVKSYLRNTMREERLTALAMFSIVKTMLNDISDFNKKMIQKFATYKTRRMELIFKSVQLLLFERLFYVSFLLRLK